MTNEAKAFRLLGINDDTDTCDVRGKVELRRVMAIEPLDADGNSDGEAIYAGSTCGARMLTRTLGRRVTAKRLIEAAAAADRALASAKRWADEFVSMGLAGYIAANANGLLNVTGGDVDKARALGRTRHAETVNEALKIRRATTAAGLIGTRFERSLPKV